MITKNLGQTSSPYFTKKDGANSQNPFWELVSPPISITLFLRPNNIIHPTRCMIVDFSRWRPRAGDDERYKEQWIQD